MRGHRRAGGVGEWLYRGPSRGRMTEQAGTSVPGREAGGGGAAASGPGEASPESGPKRFTRQTTLPSAERGGQLPPLSVIVPIKNERDNVAELVARLNGLPRALVMEIVFVDDSDDGSDAAVLEAGEHSRHDVRLIHRPPERRNGLGGAVIEGLRAARSPWACVMDGDLQHPPELIVRLAEEAEQAGVDLVVATRYGSDGDAGSLRRVRRTVSRSTTAAARLLFPLVRRFSDPMSGFFLVRRDALDLDSLRPRGFKVLLEILIKTPGLQASEVAFRFDRRRAGKSKASIQEGGRYLAQLLRLRLARFGVVGASGLVVNTVLLAAFTELAGIHYVVSAILATQGSTLWNFSLTELWVFPDRHDRRSRVARLVLFLAMNNVALALRSPILVVLTSELGVYYLASNLISLVALTLIRFGLSDRWIWARVKTGEDPPESYSYDIHGIVSVDSSVRLPELERFRIDEPLDDASIRVRVGRLGPRANGASPGPGGPDGGRRSIPRIYYDEGLGVFSFGTAIEVADRVDVVVTPLLRWSPHVLYTNVVEPILRWTFAERGYALVHAACVSVGEEALLVTAKTDTGKTTTILRILDGRDHAFLSDDLVLVRPDGRVLSYPKPLTISRHTIKAVKTPLLSRRERLALLFQSRLHSRSGRRFAMFLAASRLPVATINAVTQLLIPPPKYHVERLVPGVETAQQARATHLVVIERGGDGLTRLDEEEAVQTLMSNSEDAFGFPPYSAIEGFLHSRSESDLRMAERKVVVDALDGVPTILLRSTTMDWWRELPTALRGIEALQERDPVSAGPTSGPRGFGEPPLS
jgi:dolichol-phosphate mannosyltransferase